MSSDDRQVILVDDDNRVLGTAPRSTVHTTETPLHRAFSCHVRRSDGRWLLSRRAVTKLTWPGVWTNAFCGHPQPDEDPVEAIVRHGRDELGFDVDPSALPVALPDFRYRALDASGIVENEICPVFRATIVGEPRPDPNEVCEYVWAEPGRIHAAAKLTPWAFSPWFVMALAQLEQRWAA